MSFEEQLEEAPVVAQLRARINALTGGGGGGPPTGAAGGELSGTYPNPTIAAGAIVDAKVNAAAAIAETKLNLATDAAAGVGSRRTLGTGALQAAAGNDARLSDSRPPTGVAGGDLSGAYPSPSIAPLAVTDAKVAAANKDGAAGTPSMRTLGTGALQATAGNDNRLSDPRAPTGPAGGKLAGTYPNPGLVALQDLDFAAACIDGLATRASLRTLGTLAQQACSGADSRLSDSRAPNGPAGGDLAGTFPNPTLRKPAAHQAVVATQVNVNIASPGATIDTSTFSVAGPRILLLGQTTVAQNGLWVWNGAAVALTRPDDWLLNEIKPAGQLVSIGSGTYATRVVVSLISATVDTNDPQFTFLGPTGAAGGDLGGTYPNPTVLLAGDGTLLLRTGNTMAPVAPTDGSLVGVAGSVSVRTARVPRVVKAALAGDGATTVWTITHSLSSFQLVVGGNDPSSGVPIELDWFHFTTAAIKVTHTPALAIGDVLYVTIVG